MIMPISMQELAKNSAYPFSQKGYLAPTFYRVASSGVKSYNYYNSLQDAYDKFRYIVKTGGKNIAPAGSIALNKTGHTTMGINADFWIIKEAVPVYADYLQVKDLYRQADAQKIAKYFLARFYKTNGSGAYYAILQTKDFGIAAEKVSAISEEKLKALDQLHREVQLAKYKYNTLAEFLNQLSKRRLNNAEQQMFNEGILMLNNYERELRSFPAAKFTWAANGQVVSGIGLAPIVYVAIAVVLALVYGYAVNQITAMFTRLRAINEAYDMQKWQQEYQLKISQEEQAGHISPRNAQQLMNTSHQALTAAQNNAALITTEAASNKGSFFDEIKNLMLIGGGILIATQLLKNRSNG